MKNIVIIIFLLLCIMPCYAGIFEENGKYGYTGSYYDGLCIRWILDLPLIDKRHTINYKVPAKYDKIEEIKGYDNIIIVKKNNRKSILYRGKTVVPFGKYDDIISYIYNKDNCSPMFYFMTKLKGKMGLIQYTDEVLPPVYDSIDIESGIVVKNNKYGLYAANYFEKKLLDTVYDKIERFKNKDENNNLSSCYLVKKEGKCGVVCLLHGVISANTEIIYDDIWEHPIEFNQFITKKDGKRTLFEYNAREEKINELHL